MAAMGAMVTKLGAGMNYQLSINGNDLRNGLVHFKTRRKIKSHEKAILAFDGQYLSIESLDKVLVAGADGTWPGIAYITAGVIVAFASAPPAGDSVLLSCNGERVRFGSLTVGCKWQPVSQTLMRVEAVPDWVEAISLKYRAHRSTMISGKHKAVISEAETKLTKLIGQVAKKLAPVGITEDDLRSLVEQRLAERYAEQQPPSKG